MSGKRGRYDSDSESDMTLATDSDDSPSLDQGSSQSPAAAAPAPSKTLRSEYRQQSDDPLALNPEVREASELWKRQVFEQPTDYAGRNLHFFVSNFRSFVMGFVRNALREKGAQNVMDWQLNPSVFRWLVENVVNPTYDELNSFRSSDLAAQTASMNVVGGRGRKTRRRHTRRRDTRGRKTQNRKIRRCRTIRRKCARNSYPNCVILKKTCS